MFARYLSNQLNNSNRIFLAILFYINFYFFAQCCIFRISYVLFCRPSFVILGHFHCSHSDFRESLKPRGFVKDDLMAVLVQLLNFDHKGLSDTRA